MPDSSSLLAANGVPTLPIATSTPTPSSPGANPPIVQHSAAFAEDIVELNVNGVQSFAVVTRCWADEQSPEAATEATRLGIQFTPLAPGQLEVLHPNGTRSEVAEADIQIVDRGFLMGDIVRAASGKGQAGIITSLATSVQLRRVLTDEQLEGWFKAEEIVAAARISRGDHVVLGHWVGMVEEVFEMAMVETRMGPPRRLCDTGNTLSVGATTDTLLFDRAPFLQGLLEAGDLKRVLDVKQIVVAVNWLCVSQLADPSQPNFYQRPPRYWTDIDSLSLVRATADHLHSVGDKVVLRDPSSHPLPTALASDPHARGHHVLVVTRSHSTATVIWQDGTTTTASTPSFEHCVNIDEDVDVFPGDVGIFSVTNRVGVVQSMESKKRTVKLRWLGTDESEVVSGLEFDPHGPPPEVYGVRRQDFVLVANGSNGVPVPTVPRLGESEILTGQFPSVEGLRVELSAIGLDQASRLGDAPAPLPQTGSSLSSIDWYGEVIDLLLDGQVLVRFPSGATAALPLDRIYHLDDGLDPDAMMGGEPFADDDASMSGASAGSWETDGGEEFEGDEEMEEVGEMGWAEEEEVVEVVRETEKVLSGSGGEEKKEEGVSMPAEVEEHESWQRFMMLEQAPQDHHYSNEPIQVPSKAYMARVKKEYNVLASSLPPNILVRAYENRSDLLRCLIIGPLGTPFQNAPFLFDVFLPPTRFPLEPPNVFFHSWAGGTRISPNLYAEGKVCLSLLNTWHGDKSESWGAARSSILQIFISIQSLIMVEEPYYTEPGFEKQQTTTEGQIASELYNERTFVLTRAFVKRACEYPPVGFEDEIKAYYYSGLPTTGPGALVGIVEQAKALLEESERFHLEPSEEEDEGKKRVRSVVIPAQNVLTEGAVLSLKRTLSGLEGLL